MEKYSWRSIHGEVFMEKYSWRSIHGEALNYDRLACAKKT